MTKVRRNARELDKTDKGSNCKKDCNYQRNNEESPFKTASGMIRRAEIVRSAESTADLSAGSLEEYGSHKDDREYNLDVR
jgi:hypothetical protein